jgi:uncharacterized membrane protein
MKRVNLFLIVLIASITALVASTVAGFIVFSQTPTTPNSWMGQMWGSGGMGGHMGQNATVTPTTASSSWLPTFGVLFAVLIGVTVIAIIGVAYYLVYPQIRMGTVQPQVTLSQPAATNGHAYESVAKTLTEDERKIIEVLNAHNGKYLQKYIKNETGLSRLKTHRIIARLADRGIVSLEKSGNTNQVYLANWLTQKI